MQALVTLRNLHSAFHSAGPARRFKFKMFDSEKFISEVEARPPLYNVHLKKYSNRELKATCWAEVGEAMYEDWSNIFSY
jgi:hypothetical protein